jgi:hypothetical protein
MAEFLTSLDMIPALRKAMGNPATGDVSDASLAQYLWMGECDLAEMYDFAELRSTSDIDTINTVAGTYDYEMPASADVLKFLRPAINVTSNFPMEMQDDEWDRNIGALITGTSTPYYWFENGLGDNNRKQVRVRPIPSGVFELRFPFVKVPTMPDTDEASRFEIPASHTAQLLTRSAEIGLQLIAERQEARAQADLSAKTTWAARHALPPAAFYKHRLVTFQQRMNMGRRRRG